MKEATKKTFMQELSTEWQGHISDYCRYKANERINSDLSKLKEKEILEAGILDTHSNIIGLNGESLYIMEKKEFHYPNRITEMEKAIEAKRASFEETIKAAVDSLEAEKEAYKKQKGAFFEVKKSLVLKFAKQKSEV